MADWLDMREEWKRPDVQKKPWMDEKVLKMVNTEEGFKRIVDECIEAGAYALDLETEGLDARVYDGRTVHQIVGGCFSPDGHHGYYVPIRHKNHPKQCLPVTVWEREMKRLIESDAVAVFHNGAFDHEFLQHCGTELGKWDDPSKWEDSQILGYLSYSRMKQTGLKPLSKKVLGLEMIELKELFDPKEVKKTGMDFGTLDPTWEPVTWYAAADAICTYLLYKHYHPLIMNGEGDFGWPESVPGKPMKWPKPHGGSQKTIYAVEKLTVPATRWMQRNRIPINIETVKELIAISHREWLGAFNDVYTQVSEALGRDVRPGAVRLFTDPSESEWCFDPDKPQPSTTDQLSMCSVEADKRGMDPTFIDDKRKRRIQTIAKDVPKVTDPKSKETVAFPVVYDINSSEQLGLMFRELAIPGLKVTEKSGQVVTRADELDRVVEESGDKFSFMASIKRFRNVHKALSNLYPIYTDSDKRDNTLAVQFKQLGTDTGRFTTPGRKKGKPKQGGTSWNLHSTPATYDPNRPEGMRRIREVICARPGRKIVAIDFAGVELRIVTNYSREPGWMNEFFRCSKCGKTFNRGDGESTPPAPPPRCPNCGSDKIGDLHTLTAVNVYGQEVLNQPDFKQKRQQAKCVHPDTLVKTPNGRISLGSLPVGEVGTFHPIEGVEVLAPDQQYRSARETYNGGVKPLYHVVTRRGVLTCSAQHRFVLKDGSLQSVETGLSKGAVLPEPVGDVEDDRDYPEIDRRVSKGVPALTFRPTHATAYFAGLHAGDGSSGSTSTAITHGHINKTDPLGVPYKEWQRIVTEACLDTGLEPVPRRRQVYLGSRHVLRWMESLELVDGSRRTFRIPGWILRAGRQAMLHYLGGLFDTDGTVSPDGDMSVCTKDFVFAGQVAEVLRAVGCTASISPSWNSTYERWYLRVSIKRRDGTTLGPYMRHPGKVERISDTDTGYDRCPNEVLLVIPADTGPCIDLHVASDDHLYVANGLAVHNSSNFALCYGGGGQAVMRSTGCSKAEGWRIKNLFDKKYKGLARWWERQKAFARKHGYVLTGMGRWYPQPDIDHPNGFFRSKAERNAVNGPVQGGSADITKLAMAMVYRKMKDLGWLEKVRMIITIHDELVFEIDDDILGDAIEVVIKVMTIDAVHRLKWPVPLTVDCEIGQDWTVPWDLNEMRYGEVRFIGNKKIKSPDKVPEGYNWDDLPSWPDALIDLFSEEQRNPPVPVTGDGKMMGEKANQTSAAAFQKPEVKEAIAKQAAKRGIDYDGRPPPEIPDLERGQTYTHNVFRDNLSMKWVMTISDLINGCPGTNPLRVVVRETGDVLFEDPNVLVDAARFTVLAHHHGV